MGMLTGLPFAIFYSLMGIPIAAWADRSNRRNVLVMAVATWSGMTALFGTAVNFTMLFLTRIGTAIGERAAVRRRIRSSLTTFEGPARDGICHLRAGGAGGHVHRRGDWWVGQSETWDGGTRSSRSEFRASSGHHRVPHREGTPARDVRWCGQPGSKSEDPGMWEVLRFLWLRASFRHLSLACALHSVVWYASGAFNNAFLQRSHGMNVAEAGWISILAAIAGVGTFLGGYLSDRLSTVATIGAGICGCRIATLVCVPFQFLAYMSPSLP